MVKKSNSRGNFIVSSAVEVHLNQNRGFRCVSLNSASAHEGAISALWLCASVRKHVSDVDCGLTAALSSATIHPEMSDEAPDSLIPYDEIVQEALRAVVGRVLGEIVAGGSELPGNHHFYITFKTGAAGVSIPQNLRERFPDEMTIVLQNKFWELEVREDGFSVGLSFNQVPAKLSVPFAAITAFVDPAVDFGLQFQATGDEMEPEAHDDAENDGPGDEPPPGADDGSNVVTVDFGRKK